MYNLNSGYGMASASAALSQTLWKSFVVLGSSDANAQYINELFTTDPDGIARTHSSFTLALAQCVSGRGDYIYIAPWFTTAPTAAELLAAETKWVMILPLGKFNGLGYVEARATATLPQTATWSLFTVTGRVKVTSIVWEVTTITGATATNGKLIATPTVWSATDMCSAASVASLAVGSQLFITGTLATALQTSAWGAMLVQAAPLQVNAWVIGFNTTANNTGSIKWRIEYTPIDPWAKVIAA